MKNVSAAVIIEDRRVLLARRATGQTLAGLWEFPGGKQESHETIQECVERELLEELSVVCKAGAVLMESCYKYDGGFINLIGVLTKINGADFKLTVHDKVEWVELSDLLSYKLAPADAPIAEEILKRYG